VPSKELYVICIKLLPITVYSYVAKNYPYLQYARTKDVETISDESLACLKLANLPILPNLVHPKPNLIFADISDKILPNFMPPNLLLSGFDKLYPRQTSAVYGMAKQKHFKNCELEIKS